MDVTTAIAGAVAVGCFACFAVATKRAYKSGMRAGATRAINDLLRDVAKGNIRVEDGELVIDSDVFEICDGYGEHEDSINIKEYGLDSD